MVSGNPHFDGNNDNDLPDMELSASEVDTDVVAIEEEEHEIVFSAPKQEALPPSGESTVFTTSLAVEEYVRLRDIENTMAVATASDQLGDTTRTTQTDLVTSLRQFDLTCRLAIAFAIAALKYGSSASKIEAFLTDLMMHFGFEGSVFRCTVSEIFCCFRRRQDGATKTEIVVLSSGLNLNKLVLLSELAKECVAKDETKDDEALLEEMLARIAAIEEAPDPYRKELVFLAYMAVGGCLAMLLEGSWADIVVATVCGGMVVIVLELFSRCESEHVRRWTELAASFACSLFATGIQAMFEPTVNVALCALSGMAPLLPGYDISLGSQELISKHVLSGAARLVSGMVTMVWLLVGFWMGATLVDTITDDPVPFRYEVLHPLPKYYQAIFFPIICLAVMFLFQVSYRDTPWGVLAMGVTYGSVLLTQLWIDDRMFCVFTSSIAMTVFSSAWGMLMDRPSTVVWLPCFILTVSGSTGFRGLVRVVGGEQFDGVEQFAGMFVVALMIVAGTFVGDTLLSPRSTL